MSLPGRQDSARAVVPARYDRDPGGPCLHMNPRARGPGPPRPPPCAVCCRACWPAASPAGVAAGHGSGWGRPLDGGGMSRAGLSSMSLLHVEVVSPADLRDEVEAILRGQRGATNLVVLPGAAREPGGDLIQADLARECVQNVLSGLRELGVDRRGSISLHAVDPAIGDGVRRAVLGAADAEARALTAILWLRRVWARWPPVWLRPPAQAA